MRKILFGALVGFVIAGVLGAGTLLVAQEFRGPARRGSLVVLAGLRLKEAADVEAVESLFKEKLVPALEDLKDLKIKVLKRSTQLSAESEDTGAYDYIMMAEFKSLQGFLELRQRQDAGLSEFGDMMKKYAGSPHFNLYTVLAQTKETE